MNADTASAAAANEIMYALSLSADVGSDKLCSVEGEFMHFLFIKRTITQSITVSVCSVY